MNAKTMSLNMVNFVQPDSHEIKVSESAKQLEIALSLYIAEHNLHLLH